MRRHMDKSDAVDALAALAQPTRLDVFRMLVKAGPDGLSAGDVAETQGVPHNTMSTHLAILARAGLVASRRDGRSVIYSADIEGTRALMSFLVADCCDGHPDVCAPLLVIAERACCEPAAKRRNGIRARVPSRTARSVRSAGSGARRR
jgi:ArsR family transcriptional regulator, arsenate/arsenite/antimonite-responsive transcriptional repressor